ncbi:MAG: methyltransferase [Deltaproteobacteria bacterium]|nr:methyltransferase [Deltaproteobacteria bacterium]
MKIPLERLFDEKIAVCQPVEGYRMNLDPVLLAAHIAHLRAENTLDVGCGCGILGVLMLKSGACAKYTGIEIQPELAECAEKTISENRLQAAVIKGDIREFRKLFKHGEFDLIISNPPFYKKGGGRINPHESKARARHEIDLTANELFAAVKYLMSKNGRAFILYNAERTREIDLAINDAGLGISSLRFIHPFAGRRAESVIFEIVHSRARELRIEPPFVVYESEGKYSCQLRDFLSNL